MKQEYILTVAALYNQLQGLAEKITEVASSNDPITINIKKHTYTLTKEASAKLLQTIHEELTKEANKIRATLAELGVEFDDAEIQ